MQPGLVSSLDVKAEEGNSKLEQFYTICSVLWGPWKPRPLQGSRALRAEISRIDILLYQRAKW